MVAEQAQARAPGDKLASFDLDKYKQIIFSESFIISRATRKLASLIKLYTLSTI